MTRVINIPGSDSSNFYYDLAAGKLPSYSIVNAFGANHGLSTTDEDLWRPGGTKSYLTTAATLEVISDDVNDTAAGTGAREITIYGLDSAFNEIEETVATAGTSASTATTQTFMRVQRIAVTQAGAYGGVNAGNITVRVSSGGVTQSYIVLGAGISQGSHYTIPRGHKGYIVDMSASVQTTKTVEFFLMIRDRAGDNSAPFSSWHRIFEAEGVEGAAPLRPLAPIFIDEKTDIRAVGNVSSGTTSIANFRYQLILDHLGVGE